MFDKTHYQMNNWRWDNPWAFGDQVDHSDPQTINSGKVKRTCERFSWSGSDDLRAKDEPLSCQQYKPGDFLVVGPLNWDEMIDEDDDDVNWPDSGAVSGGQSRPREDNENADSEGEEDMQGGEIGTGNGQRNKDGKGMGRPTEDGMGNGNGKGKGNSKGKVIVKQTPGGDDNSCAVASQLEKEMSEAGLDRAG